MIIAAHKFMNHKIFLGSLGGFFYLKKGRRIYCSEKHLEFSKYEPEKETEILFPLLPRSVEAIIVDMAKQMEAQKKNWYKFLLSLTQSQREQFCYEARKELSATIDAFENSITLALKHFKEPSRIRRKAIQQLLNY